MPPTPQQLAAIVQDLNEGDKVKAAFQSEKGYGAFTIEGHLIDPRESGTLFVGGWVVREPDGELGPALSSIEILERAKTDEEKRLEVVGMALVVSSHSDPKEQAHRFLSTMERSGYAIIRAEPAPDPKPKPMPLPPQGPAPCVVCTHNDGSHASWCGYHPSRQPKEKTDG